MSINKENRKYPIAMVRYSRYSLYFAVDPALSFFSSDFA